MKKLFKYTVLVFATCTLFSFDTIFNDYENKLDALIIEFNFGVDTEDEFEDLFDKFEELEDDIEDYHESNNTAKSRTLLQKVEALTALIGELSPDGRNHLLTSEKYDLAAPLLNIKTYYHPYFEDEGEYCSTILHVFIWGGNYQALLVLNDSDKMMNFKANVYTSQNRSLQAYSNSVNEAGVDCYSLRAIDGSFVTADGVIQCLGLICERKPYCLY